MRQFSPIDSAIAIGIALSIMRVRSRKLAPLTPQQEAARQAEIERDAWNKAVEDRKAEKRKAKEMK